jgi:hypothetical protein
MDFLFLITNFNNRHLVPSHHIIQKSITSCVVILIFLEAAGLERGPLSLVRTTEELLEGKVAAPV